MSQYDIDYHTEKAETFRHLEIAARNYLAFNARTLPVAQIVNIADEIKDYEKSAKYQVDRIEFYRKQLTQAEAEPEPAIDAELIQPQEATTL